MPIEMTIAACARPLVIGYGNELRGDDGVGPAVVRTLRDDLRLDGVHLLAVRQLTPDLAADVAGASMVVLVDAARDVAPGAVDIAALSPRSLPAGGLFSHHLDPVSLAELAREVFGSCPPVTVVRLGVVHLDGEALSPAGAAAVLQAAEAVAVLVDAHAAIPRPRAGARPGLTRLQGRAAPTG